jgi:hypothetical protein
VLFVAFSHCYALCRLTECFGVYLFPRRRKGRKQGVHDEVESFDDDVQLVDGVFQETGVDADATVSGGEAVTQRRQQVRQRVVRTEVNGGNVFDVVADDGAK